MYCLFECKIHQFAGSLPHYAVVAASLGAMDDGIDGSDGDDNGNSDGWATTKT